MSAYKKLNQQDAFITTYTARKDWIASGSQYQELGIQNIVGLSGSGAYYTNDDDLVYGGGVLSTSVFKHNRRLVYRSNKHLYYSLFDNAEVLSTGSFENYLQSSYEVSGSRYLNDRVAIFSLPKEMYGTHIEPLSVSITPEFPSGNSPSGSFDNYIINNYVTSEGVNSINSVDNQYIETIETVFAATGVTCRVGEDDYIDPESEYVDETVEGGGQYLDVNGSFTNCNEIVDDGEGRLYIKNSFPRFYVGNVVYPHGQIVITNEIIAHYYNTYLNAILRWKSNLPIFTHNYHCRLKTSEFNHTLNKTSYDTSSGLKNANISGSYFSPYITTVGLYNDSNELMAVGKLGQPLPKSLDTDMVIITKLDMNFGVNRLAGGRNTPPPANCTHYFTFRNFVQIIGEGINTNSNPPFYDPRSKRKVVDDGSYQLFLKASAHREIDKEFDGKNQGITSYHLVKEERGNNSTYRAYCYVDVKATGNTVNGFTYQVNYNNGTNESNKRSEDFFINKLELYLYESTLGCGYQYETPIVSTLPGVPPVNGCTDPLASNYNPQATVDDGTCEYIQM